MTQGIRIRALRGHARAKRVVQDCGAALTQRRVRLHSQTMLVTGCSEWNGLVNPERLGVVDLDKIGRAAEAWIAAGRDEDVLRYKRCQIIWEAIGDASGEVMVGLATEFGSRAGISVVSVRQQRDAWMLALRGSTPTVDTIKAASRLTTQGVKGLAEARDRLASVKRSEADFIAEAERIWAVFEAAKKARDR